MTLGLSGSTLLFQPATLDFSLFAVLCFGGHGIFCSIRFTGNGLINSQALNDCFFMATLISSWQILQMRGQRYDKLF
jgi:hypothetical protein